MGKTARAVATLVFASAMGWSVWSSFAVMQASARLEVQELVANDLKRGEADQLREIENLRAEIQRWRRFHGMLVECHRAAVDEMMEQGRAGRAVVPPELTGFVDYPCSMLGLSEAEPGDETSSRYDFDVY